MKRTPLPSRDVDRAPQSPRWRSLLLLLALGTAAGPHHHGGAALAQPASAFAPPWAQVGGAMNAALEHEGLIWLGAGPRVLALDVSQAPRVVARTAMLEAMVSDLALDAPRNRLWVAAGESLTALDLADPRRPTVAATVILEAAAERVAVGPQRVWVLHADGAISGVATDATGAQAPSARIPAPEGLRAADLAAGRGELLRLGLRDDMPEAALHLDRWSVAMPDAPRPLPRVELPGPGGYLFGHERLLWHADQLWALHGRGLSRIGFAPGGPHVAGHDELGLGGFPVGFVLRGDRAYASFTSGYSDNYGVAVFDLSDPDDIRPLNQPSWMVGRFPGVFTGASVVVSDTYWVASSGGFLTGLDLDPETFLRLDGLYSSIGEVSVLAVDDGQLVAIARQSVQLVDRAAPLAPAHDALVSAGYHYANVDVSGDRVAIAVRGQSDVFAAQAHLHLRTGERAFERAASLGSHLPGGYYNVVALEGSTLVHVLSAIAGGVYAIYDISDPAAPVEAGRAAVNGRPTALALTQDHLLSLILDGSALRLLRHRVEDHALSEATIQPLTGGLASSASTWLARSGERVVVLASDPEPGAPPGTPRRRQQLFVVDVPADGPMNVRARTESACPEANAPAGIALADEHLFVACTGPQPSVAILDLRDPDAPRVAQQLRIPFEATGLAVADGHLYLATGATGMLVYREPPEGWSAPPLPPPTATDAPTATPPRATATGVSTATPTRAFASATPTRGATIRLPWVGR